MTKTLMLLLTYQCNLRCTYCYEPKTQHKAMSAADAKRYIAESVGSLGEEYDQFEVQFMGGEPLLEFDTILEVSEWLWSTPFGIRLNNVFVVTNGTLLTPRMKKWLDENHHRITLGLSFDGTDKMQDTNRSGSSSRVDLEYFSSRWPSQAVKMTVSPYSLRMFAEGVKFLHSSGFSNVSVDMACGDKIGWCANHLLILKEQLGILSDFYMENRDITPCSALSVDIFDVGDTCRPLKNCACGEALTCIDTDGTHYACHLFSPVACDEKKAAQGRKIPFSDHDLFANPTCRRCGLARLCPHCYGMNFSSAGDVAKQAPFICQSFKIIYLANCRHQYRMAVADKDPDRMNQIARLIDNFIKIK